MAERAHLAFERRKFEAVERKAVARLNRALQLDEHPPDLALWRTQHDRHGEDE